MDSPGTTVPPDPEFQASAAPLLRGPLEEPGDYLRIVVNPFLAIFGFILWLKVLAWISQSTIDRELLGPLSPIIAVVLLGALWMLQMLLQFHCLDCGATGRLSRWQEHSCAASYDRRWSGRRRRFPLITPFYQILLWLWFLALLGYLCQSIRQSTSADRPAARPPVPGRPERGAWPPPRR